MMTSERFIMIVVLLNIMIGVATTAYNQEYNLTHSQQVIRQDETEYTIQNSRTTDALWEGTTSTKEFAESGIWGKVTAQLSIWNILINGLTPWSASHDVNWDGLGEGHFINSLNSNPTMQMFATMLTWFRLLVDILAGLLIYKIFINKGTN